MTNNHRQIIEQSELPGWCVVAGDLFQMFAEHRAEGIERAFENGEIRRERLVTGAMQRDKSLLQWLAAAREIYNSVGTSYTDVSPGHEREVVWQGETFEGHQWYLNTGLEMLIQHHNTDIQTHIDRPARSEGNKGFVLRVEERQ